MLKSRRLMMVVISLVAVTFILRGIYRAYWGPPVITIINDSPYELTDVVLQGDPFLEVIGQLPIGATQTVVVHPVGESGLSMRFVTNGHRIAKDDLAYIETYGGYCVTLLIDKQLEIRSIFEGISCFAIRRAL